jgi:hypothetical protein
MWLDGIINFNECAKLFFEFYALVIEVMSYDFKWLVVSIEIYLKILTQVFRKMRNNFRKMRILILLYFRSFLKIFIF